MCVQQDVPRTDTKKTFPTSRKRTPILHLHNQWFSRYSYRLSPSQPREFLTYFWALFTVLFLKLHREIRNPIPFGPFTQAVSTAEQGKYCQTKNTACLKKVSFGANVAHKVIRRQTQNYQQQITSTGYKNKFATKNLSWTMLIMLKRTEGDTSSVSSPHRGFRINIVQSRASVRLTNSGHVAQMGSRITYSINPWV